MMIYGFVARENESNKNQITCTFAAAVDHTVCTFSRVFEANKSEINAMIFVEIGANQMRRIEI